MSRRVVFDQFGGIDQFHIIDEPEPQVGPGQVRVRVLFAGLNPVDWKILAGGHGSGLSLPSGNGNDFSGVIDQVSGGVDGWAIGDLVFGGNRFFAQADHLVVDPSKLHHLPDGLGLDVAAGLDITAKTAIAGVRAIRPGPSDTVFISGAAGGVGILAVQIARATGARVIGSASRANHQALRALDIEPVAYGDGLADALRELAPEGITAAYSTRDEAEVEMLLELGVPGDRIDTITLGPQARELGVLSDGMSKAHEGDLDALAGAIARGVLIAPIDSVYSLDDVVEAYRHLSAGHLRGKVLLRTADGADLAAVLEG